MKSSARDSIPHQVWLRRKSEQIDHTVLSSHSSWHEIGRSACLAQLALLPKISNPRHRVKEHIKWSTHRYATRRRPSEIQKSREFTWFSYFYLSSYSIVTVSDIRHSKDRMDRWWLEWGVGQERVTNLWFSEKKYGRSNYWLVRSRKKFAEPIVTVKWLKVFFSCIFGIIVILEKIGFLLKWVCYDVSLYPQVPSYNLLKICMFIKMKIWTILKRNNQQCCLTLVATQTAGHVVKRQKKSSIAVYSLYDYG